MPERVRTVFLHVLELHIENGRQDCCKPGQGLQRARRIKDSGDMLISFFDHWVRELVKVFSGFAAIAIIVANIVPVRSTMVGEMGYR